MNSPSSHRHDAEAGYILHSYPYRETSLLIEVFTRNFGRFSLVARGARRPKSALRGVLLSFSSLALSWSGKTELKTLNGAEWRGGYLSLKGAALICGFYVNELLLKLLHRDDPHGLLFDAYEKTLHDLSEGMDPAASLRCFEVNLLRELGYALSLDRDATNDKLIDPLRRYTYVIERGPVAVEHMQNGVELHGKTLLDMHAGQYLDPVTRQQSKQLMRSLISHYLGNQQLHSRQLLRDLLEL
jgi:DNA repair protein RecO (recombination protein O)